MNIGQLKHRISLLEERVIPSDKTVKGKEWVETKKMWAHIEKKEKTIGFENNKRQTDTFVYFVVRYQDIPLINRIRHNGVDYIILEVLDRKADRRFLRIETKEVK